MGRRVSHFRHFSYFSQNIIKSTKIPKSDLSIFTNAFVGLLNSVIYSVSAFRFEQ